MTTCRFQTHLFTRKRLPFYFPTFQICGVFLLLLLFSSAAWSASGASGNPLLGGRFAGSARVGNSGAANYSVPITVPPGTNGVAPILSFIYDSQSQENESLGIHWLLGGLSSIERCAATVAQDGVKGNVNYDASDRFCLDGVRLIMVSGSTYGADNTEYRTEIDTFVKIKAFGTAGDGPPYFKIWTKAGEVMELGNTADSRIEAQGKPTVRVWAINKLQDVSGNYLAVSYAEDNATGDYRPTRIDYTGNAAGSLTPSRSVQFFYGSRSDIYPLYIGGSQIASMQLLTNVKTYVGTTLVRDYRVTYENGTATGRSRLKSITECAADGACLPANTFGWQESGQGFTNPSMWAQHGGSYNAGQAQYPDFDGDGKADLIFQDTDNKYWVSFSTGSLFTSPALWMQHGGTYNPGQTQYADLNGDSKADMIFQSNENLFHVSISTGSGFMNPSVWATHGGTFASGMAQYADLDGDGRADLIFRALTIAFGYRFQPAVVLLLRQCGSNTEDPLQTANHNTLTLTVTAKLI